MGSRRADKPAEKEQNDQSQSERPPVSLKDDAEATEKVKANRKIKALPTEDPESSKSRPVPTSSDSAEDSASNGGSKAVKHSVTQNTSTTPSVVDPTVTAQGVQAVAGPSSTPGQSSRETFAALMAKMQRQEAVNAATLTQLQRLEKELNEFRGYLPDRGRQIVPEVQTMPTNNLNQSGHRRNPSGSATIQGPQPRGASPNPYFPSVSRSSSLVAGLNVNNKRPHEQVAGVAAPATAFHTQNSQAPSYGQRSDGRIFAATGSTFASPPWQDPSSPPGPQRPIGNNTPTPVTITTELLLPGAVIYPNGSILIPSQALNRAASLPGDPTSQL